jgi:hypothetical protein
LIVSASWLLSSLVALSTGEKVERPQFTKRAARELRRRQRAVARCKRGLAGVKDLVGVVVAERLAASQQAPRRRLAAS